MHLRFPDTLSHSPLPKLAPGGPTSCIRAIIELTGGLRAAAASSGHPSTQPQRFLRRPFTGVSIPELDEDLEQHAIGRSGVGGDAYDMPINASHLLKPPTVASKTLAHAMTKAMLGSNGKSSASISMSRNVIMPTLSCPDGGDSRVATAGSPPVLGDPLVTPRGAESEALARLDYDTSQTLTQFSDVERPMQIPLEGLEGLPPPDDGERGRKLSVSWPRLGSVDYIDSVTALLSPRDKSSARGAPLPATSLPRAALLEHAFLAQPKQLSIHAMCCPLPFGIQSNA
jgi:hypothetical protein